MDQLSISFEPQRRLFTVSGLTQLIRELLGGELGDIWVAGEISGTRQAASGHWYFTLKDESAQLRCVCFKPSARYLKFKPQDGVAVLARGRIDVYEARGEYQLLVEDLEPKGYGALQLAFEQLKKKLAAEGLFEAARKRALPKLPRRIGIVTSPTGAVIQDMLNVFGRRFPGLHIRLWPALVQGEGSAAAVTRGLEYFSASGWAEVVIVARGGGSLEDLWTFNEEAVARAIAACSAPVVSAIGHETDFTISDFVADLRAPTPSAAAELVICPREQLFDQIASSQTRLAQALRYRVIARTAQRLDEFDYRLRERARALIEDRRRAWRDRDRRLRRMDLRLRLAEHRRRLEAAGVRAASQVRLRLARARARLDELAAHLSQLSPLAILERGYAFVRNEAGALVKQPSDAPPGSDITVRLAKGELAARVTGSPS